MIFLNPIEAQITALVIREALGLSVAPELIKGIEVHSVESQERGLVETVIVTTTEGLQAIGKSYFQELVKKYKAAIAEVEIAVTAPVRTPVRTPVPTQPRRQTYAQATKARAAKLLGFPKIESKQQLKAAIVNRSEVSFMEAVNLERTGRDFYDAVNNVLNRIEYRAEARKRLTIEVSA